MRKFLVRLLCLLYVDKAIASLKSLLVDCYVYRLKEQSINLNFVNQGSEGIVITSMTGDLSKFSIDSTSHLKSGTFIDCTGGVKIGRFMHTGRSLTIFSSNHNYNHGQFIPYDEKEILKQVIINDFVWIGSNVTIVPGVVIGEGAVIGSGSVITKNVPDFAVVGGNPASIIKYRDIDHFLKLKEEGKFY
jgi:acetyltransferase-like isoleucine patch superfamily enzyme